MTIAPVLQFGRYWRQLPDGGWSAFPIGQTGEPLTVNSLGVVGDLWLCIWPAQYVRLLEPAGPGEGLLDAGTANRHAIEALWAETGWR